jgi:hypothetical protein
LIGVFIDSYLRLTGEEMKQYEREFEKLAPEVRENAMEFMTDWERRGMEQGIIQGIQQGVEQGIEQGIGRGAERVLSRLIRKRFSNASTELLNLLGQLSTAELDELSESILDFNELSELEQWFSRAIN